MERVLVMFRLIAALFFIHGPHMSSAQRDGGHHAVENTLCAHLPGICPCVADHLVVLVRNTPIVCGSSQPTMNMARLPTIRPPQGTELSPAVTI